MKERNARQQQNTAPLIKSMVIPLLIFAFFVIIFLIGVKNVASVAADESREILQDAVMRTTVQCYAIEGMYPPNVAYLEDNYGLTFDRDRFIVHYEVFADNIPPEVFVIDLAD